MEAQREDAFTFLHHYLGKHPPLSSATRVMWMEVFTLDALSRSKTTVQLDSVVAAFQRLLWNAFAHDAWSHDFRHLLLSLLEHDYAAVLERYGEGLEDSSTTLAAKKAKRTMPAQSSDDKKMIFMKEMDDMPLAYLALAKVEGETVKTSFSADKIVDDAMRRFNNAEV